MYLGSLVTIWTEILTRVKEYTEPSGHSILQEILNTKPPFEKAFVDGDLSALKSLYRVIAKLGFDLLPHVKYKKLANLAFYASSECMSLAQKLGNGADLNDVANFENQLPMKCFAALNQ